MASGILGSVQHRLPTELVLLIVDHLAGDNQALCTLARTCRALQHLAEEEIYKTIELFTVRDLHVIIEAFKYRHERVRAVQTLKLQYHYDTKDLDETTHTRSTFNECIAHMVNLREWHIESPYDNCHWDDDGDGPQQWVEGDMERFRKALEFACTEGPREREHIHAQRRLGNIVDRTVGLGLLERLTIHSHGVDSDFWDLDGFQCLFRHPTLRHIHVSCVSFTEEFTTLQTYPGKTPLTTLIFDECEITPASLHAVLRTPARLKHLTLGENVWNTHRSKRIKPRLTRNATASLEALSAVAHSLESLTHWDPSWKLDPDSHKPRRMSPPGDGMRNFHALRYMQCETTSFLHQAVIMNHEMAPPNLQTLRLCRHWHVPVDFFDHPPEVETYLSLPSLSTLELMQSSHCILELSQSEYICEPERLRNRHAYAYKLYKAGINLKILMEMHRDQRLIPPFLHGEAVPIIDCLYDAEDVGFHRHLTEYHDTAPDKQSNSLNANTDRLRPPRTSDEPAPETDQLSDTDVSVIASSTSRALDRLKTHFTSMRRRSSSLLDFPQLSDEDEFEFDDFSDDEDFDVEMDEDDMNVVFHEVNGQLYMEVYETDSEDEDEDEDEDEEGDMEGVDGSGEVD
jgi:hypothetical protein